VQAATLVVPDIGFIEVDIVEKQIPITSEDGEQIALVVAEVGLGYDFHACQVLVELKSFEIDGVRYENHALPSINTSQPISSRFIEKLVTKKIYTEIERAILLRESDAFIQIRGLIETF